MLKKTFIFTLVFGLIFGISSIRAENTAISVSDVRVSNISSASATITWNSSAAGDSQIRYNESSNEFTNVWQVMEASSEGKTSHTASLKGLKPGATYFFQVKTVNVNLGEAISNTNSFTTLTEVKPDLIITDIYFSPNTPTSWQHQSKKSRPRSG